MIEFLFGVFFGAIAVVAVIGIFFLNVFGNTVPPPSSPDQFVPLQLPPELSKFLNAKTNGLNDQREPCLGLSLILHFLFQEHKDTRELRRWIHRRVQLELNDLTTRSAASRVIQDIKIRDLTMGSQIPIIKSIQVEKCTMSDDGEGFEELSFFVEVDYKGGFQISLDTVLLFVGDAQLSIKLIHLIGRVRVMFTRQPYPLWAFSFAEMPDIDFKIDPHLQGRQIGAAITLINMQIKRAIMKKHVWPNYKIRNRPLFPNPLLQPSPQLSAFDHIDLNDHGLEITVLKSTRLNTKLATSDQVEVYCIASLDQRPFIHNAEAGSSHTISVLLTLKPFVGDFGMTFTKSVADLGTRAIKVQTVLPDSPAEKFGFKEGDVLLAINSHPITNERAVNRLLGGLSTDIVVLVERNLSFYIDDNAEAGESNSDKDDFVRIEDKSKKEDQKLPRSVSDVNFRNETPPSPQSPMISSSSVIGNFENLEEFRRSPSDPNILSDEREENLTLQLSSSLPVESNLEVFHVRDLGEAPRNTSNSSKPRPQSFKVPILEVRQPSVDLRRTMSDGHLDSKIEEEPGNQEQYRKSSSALNSPIFEDAESNFDRTSVETHSTDQPDQQDTVDSGDTAPPTHRSKRERLHARAFEMASKFNEGAAKFTEYWKGRASNSPSAGNGSDIEFAAEASESLVGDSPVKTASPTPSYNKEEKVRRRWLSRARKSPTPSSKSQLGPQIGSQPVEGPSSSRNPPRVFSRSTKSVRLAPNVMWGQSLHFVLDKKDTRYLNITVLARTPIPKDNVSQRSESELDLKPTLLGSRSIYVPQIIADCQLTLSNCHCENFALRPPTCNSFNMESFGSISKHPGFDPRLCYGDITLRFRHFPEGLPQNALQKYEEDSTANESEAEMADEGPFSHSGEMTQEQSDLAEKIIHQWTTISMKSPIICAVCCGKIWLKSGSRCKKCNMVVHNKCCTKAKHRNCSASIDDENFELLDNSELQRNSLRASTTSSSDLLPSPDDSTSLVSENSNETTTKRRRLANKISSTLSKVGFKREKSVDQISIKSADTPKTVLVKDVLEPNFMSSLKGSPAVYELYFEPGNSYNEAVINKMKNLGSKVFSEERNYYQRKTLIDAQVDLVKQEIDKTALIRREMDDKSGKSFEILDMKMQALALLMLHYCAGIQDCEDNMNESTSQHGLLESTLTDIAE
ncbi:hypothetical protein FO519_001272 [Halicephalobus sp. NKZ332]|nr:hypothetical protein FO519_001272 [Halicephalobus sp. NKZ332]